MLLVENFKKNLKPNYYDEYKDVKNLTLRENKGKGYSVEFKITKEKNHFLVIKDLEDLKVNDAKYLIHQPKDCDYVILDLKDKVIYLVELKDTDISNLDFMKQLNAGEKWLSHLLFCCKCIEEDFILDNKEWLVKRVGVRYHAARPSKTYQLSSSGSFKRLADVAGKELILLKGKYFILDKIKTAR